MNEDFTFEFLYDEGVPIDPPVIVPRVPHHKAKVKKPNYLPEHAGVGGDVGRDQLRDWDGGASARVRVSKGISGHIRRVPG